MAVKLILNFVLKGKKKNQNNQHSFLLYHKSIQYTLTINLGTCIELKKNGTVFVKLFKDSMKM